MTTTTKTKPVVSKEAGSKLSKLVFGKQEGEAVIGIGKKIIKTKTKPKAAPKQKAAPKKEKQTRVTFDDGAKISMIEKTYPRKPGSERHAAWKAAAKSKTYADYVKAGGTHGGMKWLLRNKMVKLA